ncbi:FecR domain-containing protein [Candidatus Omnitrophota bacterium]
MRKLFLVTLVSIFAAVLFSSNIFAQGQAKIIDLRGNVQIKCKVGSSCWEEAQLDMLLEEESQIKTTGDSQCLLTFDQELENVVEVKENTQMTIKSVEPGEIFLPQGRVFAIIEGLSEHEKFEVKTPTATAGARGTGWSTESSKEGTKASCFENKIYVNSPRADTKNIPTGSGINVGPDGKLGNLFGLGNKEWAEWGDFKKGVQNRRNEKFEQVKGSRRDDSLDDLMGEAKDAHGEDFIEEQRTLKEAQFQSTRNQGGNGYK